MLPVPPLGCVASSSATWEQGTSVVRNAYHLTVKVWISLTVNYTSVNAYDGCFHLMVKDTCCLIFSIKILQGG